MIPVGRTTRNPGGRMAGCALAALAGTLLALLPGCLDIGGPGPAATTRPAAALPRYVHKPFAEDKCTACHTETGTLLASARRTDGCLECHKGVKTEKLVMHGPVATGACLSCHAPHESTVPGLLLASGQTLCTGCHERATLSLRATAHRNSRRNCLDCHYGHGGPGQFLLKPDAERSTIEAVYAE